jgi:hypothetical protein
MKGVMMRLRRWLRYRHAASMAAQERIHRGHWLTARHAGEIREREKRFAGMYPTRAAERPGGADVRHPGPTRAADSRGGHASAEDRLDRGT